MKPGATIRPPASNRRSAPPISSVSPHGGDPIAVEHDVADPGLNALDDDIAADDRGRAVAPTHPATAAASPRPGGRRAPLRAHRRGFRRARVGPGHRGGVWRAAATERLRPSSHCRNSRSRGSPSSPTPPPRATTSTSSGQHHEPDRRADRSHEIVAHADRPITSPRSAASHRAAAPCGPHRSAIAPPEPNGSAHPRCPHAHSGPSVRTGTWPTSPAMPIDPRWILPSSTSPAASPVPMLR